ncbi:MAG TPA: hypothetical protein VGP72_32700 [Planctomycetota bacterium]|jgi:hypothetical protein
MAEPLLEELEVLQQNEKELRTSFPGKYVLIKGQQIIGTYDKQYEAISEAYTRFGNVPFFIKRIAAR